MILLFLFYIIYPLVDVRLVILTALLGADIIIARLSVAEAMEIPLLIRSPIVFSILSPIVIIASGMQGC
jgi:hypothetical protein